MECERISSLFPCPASCPFKCDTSAPGTRSGDVPKIHHRRHKHPTRRNTVWQSHAFPKFPILRRQSERVSMNIEDEIQQKAFEMLNMLQMRSSSCLKVWGNKRTRAFNCVPLRGIIAPPEGNRREGGSFASRWRRSAAACVNTPSARVSSPHLTTNTLNIPDLILPFIEVIKCPHDAR